MEISRVQPSAKITFFERLAYGFGDLGCNIIYSAMSAFLLYYYTDYVNVSALTVGTIMLVSRLLDGFTDLVMGVIVDRTKSKHGKARPWIIRMAIPFSLAAVLLFSVPLGLSETGKIIYIFVTYNLVSSVVYTMINVPYATLNALITQDQYERSVLSIFRMILATTGTLIITNLTLPLMHFFGNDASAWTKTFVVFGILAFGAFVITFVGTKERVKPAEATKTEDVPFTTGIKLLFQNKYWVIITLTLIFIFINYSLNGGAAIYYAKVILKDTTLIGPMNLMMSVVQIVAMFFTANIIKKTGKRNMLIIGSLIYGIGFLAFAFVGTSYVGVMLASAIKGLGNAGISSCMFAIVSDTIEYGEWKTGYRTEGLINSASSFGFKVGSGLGSAMLGWILAFGQYNESSMVQPDSSIFAIKFLFIYLPAVITLIQIAIMLFYKLDAEYDDILEKLNKR